MRLIALALALTAFAAPALAGQPVTLKTQTTAAGPVTLGDIFEGAGRAAGVVIAPSPTANGSMVIDAALAHRMAMANGLTWANEQGVRRIVVRAGFAAPVADSASADKPQGKGVEVLTWTHSLDAGDIVQAEDLTWTVMPSQPAGAARDADQLIGKQVKKPLRSGSVATLRDAGAPMVIKKDDFVTVAFISGGVELSLQGKAMGPAAVGETLTVANQQSKKTFQAVASGPGRAVVGPQADALRAQTPATPSTLALR